MVLATILLNPLPSAHSLVIPKNMKAAKTTLIITPASILHQWIEETKKNAPKLQFMVFEGGEVEDGVPIDHAYLSKKDIIFITYQTLQREIHAARPGRTGERRKNRVVKRRYSPLVMTYWWRVVLDEAQMVANLIGNAAEMACMLPREHSWSVTGTPCSNTGKITEMAGLFTFTRSSCFRWKGLRQLPDGELMKLLSLIVHRNTKANVEAELHIPLQTDNSFLLELAAVEEQYYSDLVEQAIADLGPAPEKLNSSTLSRSELEAHQRLVSSRLAKMNPWFLRLRQTCCHPRVSAENRKVMSGRVQTMGDVVDSMIEKSEGLINTNDRTVVRNEIELGYLLE